MSENKQIDPNPPRTPYERLLGSGSKSEAAWSVVIAMVCLGPLLAYLLPERPFAIWPWAMPFCNFVAQFVPGIDHLTEISAMPEVTRLFMSLQWTVAAPVYLAIFLRYGRATSQSVTHAMRAAEARWWYFIFGTLAMAVLAWFCWELPFTKSASSTTPYRHVVDAMSQSRFWVGVYGSMIVMSGVAFFVLFFKSFSLIRLAYSVRATSPLYRRKSK